MAIPPRRVDPPFNEAPIRSDGQFSQAWSDYFRAASDRLNELIAADAVLAASTSYANDAAAAAGGVAIGQRYRNGSVVQVRVV